MIIIIQIITTKVDKENYKNFSNEFIINEFDRYDSLDSYDTCIINLTHPDIWKYTGATYKFISLGQDLIHIKSAIEKSKKSKITILLPNDIDFMYDYRVDSRFGGKKYYNSIKLKNILNDFISIIDLYIIKLKDSGIQLCYEPSRTKINGEIFDADFYFLTMFPSIEKATISEASEKTTTIKVKNVIITTLQLQNDEVRYNTFLSSFYETNNIVIPEWIENVNFYNDKELNKEYTLLDEKKQKLELQISSVREQIDSNQIYKSILYQNGDILEQIVRKILSEILDFPLADFVDEKKEDFLINKSNTIFIGEIKGVSKSAHRTNITQVDEHKSDYMARTNNQNSEDEIKCILIINHQIQKDISEREPIHIDLIKVAERRDILIIETKTLLKLYEKFLMKELTVEECVEILKDNIGLLTVDKLKKAAKEC